MPQEVEIIDPLDYPRWEELVLATKNYSFFHSSTWAEVLQESYGYKPLYFTMLSAGRLLAVIPCMEIKSVLTGRRGVSLPFTDYCEPVIEEGVSDDTFLFLLNRLIAHGKKAAWKSIEFRSGISLPGLSTLSGAFWGHTLELSEKYQEIFSAFRDSTRRNIKKAVREGVQVGFFNSLDSIREFYRLNCLTRKEHGVPAQPFRFFEKIYEHVISKEKGFVALSFYKNTCIAGAVYLHFGQKAMYKFGASDSQYQHLRANNLVMWEAIKRYAQNGYKRFCFGRTELDNEGLLHFKRGWGPQERTIRYYKYDVKGEAFVCEAGRLSEGHKKIFHWMPIPLLKLTGAILYKHIG